MCVLNATPRPVDCSPPGSSVHGFFQATIVEWVAIPFSRGSSRPRDRTRISCVSCITGSSLPTEPSGKPVYSKGEWLLFPPLARPVTFIYPQHQAVVNTRVNKLILQFCFSLPLTRISPLFTQIFRMMNILEHRPCGRH